MISRNSSNPPTRKVTKKIVQKRDYGGLILELEVFKEVEVPFMSSLESFPDDVVVHIGKTVAKLCDVRSYNALASTSRRFQTLLKNDAMVSDVLESANRRIMDQFLEGIHEPGNVLFGGVPKTFDELKLWQTASEAMQGNKLYSIGDKLAYTFEHGRLFHDAICKIMTANQSAIVILETHGQSNTPNETSEELSMRIGCSSAMNLTDMFSCSGPEAIEWVKSQVFIRPWGDAAVASAIAIDDDHGKQVAQGKSWLEVFFRVNGVEFPPRSCLYEGLDFPKLIPYADHHDRIVSNLSQMATVDPQVDLEEIEGNFLTSIERCYGVGKDPKIILEAMLVEMRVTGTNAVAPQQSNPNLPNPVRMLMAYREQLSAPSSLVTKAENEDSYGLLIEIITKAGRKKPTKVLAVMKKEFRRHGSIGMGPWLDELLRDVM